MGLQGASHRNLGTEKVAHITVGFEPTISRLLSGTKLKRLLVGDMIQCPSTSSQDFERSGRQA